MGGRGQSHVTAIDPNRVDTYALKERDDWVLGGNADEQKENAGRDRRGLGTVE